MSKLLIYLIIYIAPFLKKKSKKKIKFSKSFLIQPFKTGSALNISFAVCKLFCYLQQNKTFKTISVQDRIMESNLFGTALECETDKF